MTRSRFLRPIAALSGILLVSWFVTAVTIDQVMSRLAPASALVFNPGSADANAGLAAAMVQDDAGVLAARGTVPPSLTARVRARALRSLDRQPVNPAGARLLAFATATGDPARAHRLLAYAEAMSRRDLPTQLALIENSVQRGAVAGALVHYNRALSANAEARPLLYPILAAAANEPAVWRPLSVMLARRPQWWRPFVEMVAAQGTSPASLYAFARRLGLERGPTSDFALLQAMEKRLVDLGAYASAADLYDRAHGVAHGRRPLLNNGGFEQPGGWDPFDWNLVEQPDLAALRQPSPAASGGTALFLDATNGRGGDVAVQLMTLPPGAYRIGALAGAVRGDRLAFPQMVVRCARDGRELLHAPFPPALDGGTRWHVDLTVPAGCAAQRLVIQASSALEASGPTPWIDDVAVELLPARRPGGGR